MSAAPFCITFVIGLTVAFNLHRVYTRINRDYGSSAVGGWIIATPMMIVTVVGTTLVYFLAWHGQGLTYDQVSERVMLVFMTMFFGPVVGGTIVRVAKDRQDKERRDRINADPDRY